MKRLLFLILIAPIIMGGNYRSPGGGSDNLTSCSNNEFMQYNGTDWVCASGSGDDAAIDAAGASPSVTSAGVLQCDSNTVGACYTGDGTDERRVGGGDTTIDWNPSPAGGTTTAGLAEAISEANALGGGIIQMRCDGSSSYTITSSTSPAIALASDIHLRGCGFDTPLTWTLTSTTGPVSMVGLLIENDENVTVENLYFDWNETCNTNCDATQSGQVISVQEGSQNIRILNNVIDIDDDIGDTDAATRGIWVTDSFESGDNGTDQQEPRNVLIQGNTIHQTGRSAIEVSYGLNVSIVGNMIDFSNRPTTNTATGYGVLLHECQGCAVTGNVVDVGALQNNAGALANTINCFSLTEKSNATDADGNNSGRSIEGNACIKMWTGTRGVAINGSQGSIVANNVFQAGRCWDTTGGSELFQGCYSDEDCTGLGGTTPICRNAGPGGVSCLADDSNETGGPRNITISGNVFSAGQGHQDGADEEWDGGWANEPIDIETSAADALACSDITIANNRALQTTLGGAVTATLDFISWEDSAAENRNTAYANYWAGDAAQGQFRAWNAVKIDADVSGSGGVLFMEEQAEADADVAAYGQFWVDNTTPNTPMFTDDAGTDGQLCRLGEDETITGTWDFQDSLTEDDLDLTSSFTFQDLSGKQVRNTDAVSDDDCTGETGSWWYDTTDGQFEFCNQGDTTPPSVLGGGSGLWTDNGTDIIPGSNDDWVRVAGDATAGAIGSTDGTQINIDTNGTSLAAEYVLESTGFTTCPAMDFACAITATSFTADPSATPSVSFQDSDMGGTPDTNSSIVANCIAGTTAGGDEDCEMAFSTQISGSLDEAFRIDADSSTQKVVFTAPTAGIQLMENIQIESPADADNFLIFKAPVALTITDIHCVVDPADSSESVVIDIQERTSTGDTPATVDATITCDNDGAEDDGTLTNGAIDAGDWVSIDIGTVTGTVTQVAVSIYYDYD